MRREERTALAAIIASGLVGKLPTGPNALRQVADSIATQALAVADAILNKTEPDARS